MFLSTFASSGCVKYRLLSLSFLAVSKIMSTVGGSLLPKTQDNKEFVDQQNLIFPVIASLSLISLQILSQKLHLNNNIFKNIYIKL